MAETGPHVAQTDPAALHQAGVVAAQGGEIARAIPMLERAAAALPDDPLVRANLGKALVVAGRAADAAFHFEAAVALDDADTEAWQLLGEARLEACPTRRQRPSRR